MALIVGPQKLSPGPFILILPYVPEHTYQSCRMSRLHNNKKDCLCNEVAYFGEIR